VGQRRRAGTGAGGGELIPSFRPAHGARLAAAFAALALTVALGALAGADAGNTDGLAWLGTALAALVLSVGLAAGLTSAVHCAVALLAATFLLRQDARLLLAPLYGLGLLLVEDLAMRSIELTGVERVSRGVLAARLSVVLAVGALGACAAGAAAIAVTVGPERSVIVTALGAIAALVTFGAITRFARRRYPAGHPAVPKGDGDRRDRD
jgi:hypothetical protein